MVHIQRPIWRKLQAAMESIDKKKRLLTSETITKITWTFIVVRSAIYLLELFIEEQCKAVHQGAEVEATKAS